MIIEVTNVSSNKAKHILINTGSLNGARENQEFTVIELTNKEVGGKVLTKEERVRLDKNH